MDDLRDQGLVHLKLAGNGPLGDALSRQPADFQDLGGG
jgi:hypothetical protein